MSIYSSVQTLEPGAWVELYELDARAITGGGTGDILRSTGIPRSVLSSGRGGKFGLWPIQATGFKIDPTQPLRPSLAVGNVDGRITALCLACQCQDLVGAKLTRRRTLGKYLDAANFPAGNPTADASQEVPPDIWFLKRRSGEGSSQVTWELASPMDFNSRGRSSPTSAAG